MKKIRFVSASEAVHMIEDGSTICTIGMSLVSASETILKEIENEFLEQGHPHDLTLFHTCGQAAMKQPFGIQHLAHEGLLKRIIGGHWGQASKIMELISQNKIEAFNLPQGQMANMFHSMALREPGKLSKVGLGTYIDPRLEGGKMNQRTKDCGYDVVDIVNVDGEDYIRYKSVPINTLIIRGTTADENGNITTEEEAMVLEVLPAVMATKRFGGKVIAQVKNTAKAGTLSPKDVVVPGVFVDAVVVCPNPIEDHRQTYSWYYDPSYSGQGFAPESSSEPAAGGIRKFIARRALSELVPDQTINIGTGIPNDVIGPIIAEEGVGDKVTITVESGVYGGVPAQTIDFGISMNANALIQHDRQFEFYNGTGVDFTFMGAGEMDEEGNINATRMGDKSPGAGGFVDITATAKNVIFCSTFTGGGLKANFDNDGVHIAQEGKFKKMVRKVQQISYNGKIARKNGQKMIFVTERAVFEMTDEGPLLTELAKGIDLQRDVLDQMEFMPRIADHLKQTSTALYREGPFGLKALLEKEEKSASDRLRIHHVGIVLPDRARAEQFMNIFHFKVDREEYVKAYSSQCIFTRHKENEVALELIIPTEGVLTTYNNGKGGLHHIALEVEDVEAARQELEEKGLQMLEEHAVPGACGIIVNFLRPKYGVGILVEFVQRLNEESI